jgi:hypothetical protein
MAWQNNGLTPLYAAAYNDKVEAVRALLDVGATVDQDTVGHSYSRGDTLGCWAACIPFCALFPFPIPRDVFLCRW